MMEIICKRKVIASVNIINNLVNEDFYVNTLAKTVKGFDFKDHGKVLFSYHNFPSRHIKKFLKLHNDCLDQDWMLNYTNEKMYCYRSSCYKTTVEIGEEHQDVLEQYDDVKIQLFPDLNSKMTGLMY